MSPIALAAFDMATSSAPPRQRQPFAAPTVPPLARPMRTDHVDKTREQIEAVARTRRGFRVILHGERRPTFERDAAIRTVEQRDMGLLGVRRQARALDPEAMVHRGDLDLA